MKIKKQFECFFLINLSNMKKSLKISANHLKQVKMIFKLKTLTNIYHLWLSLTFHIK